ncbi:MAG: adenosylcobinamide-GDP ribazoletransferase [Mycobacteriales bacterium]
MPDGLRLALTTLTVVPVRGPQRLDRATAGPAMALAPVIGLGLAAVLVPVLLIVDVLGSPLLAATLVIALHALLTRGLHLDGLADLADGLGSYRSPEAARQVMKAPDVGALGLVAVVLVLLVQVAALAACLDAGHGGTALLVALVTARVAVTAACTTGVPAAAQTGLGALVAGTVGRGTAAALAVAAAAVGTAALALEADGRGALLLPAAAVLAGLGVARLLRRHAVRRIGGITGDVLGALVEVTTGAVLLVLALGR